MKMLNDGKSSTPNYPSRKYPKSKIPKAKIPKFQKIQSQNTQCPNIPKAKILKVETINQLNKWQRFNIKSAQNTWMLNNYFIDILIKTLNINILTINFHKLLQIQCPKLTTHLASTSQKLTILKVRVFQSTGKMENFVGRITIFLAASTKFWDLLQFCPTVPKSLWRESQVCLKVKTFCELL